MTIMRNRTALILTIDGPAGVGKSTLAARLAERLRIARLDTGAMFRIIAKELGEGNLDRTDEELEEKLSALRFGLTGTGRESSLTCNGRGSGQEIRSEAVGLLASRYAAKPVVRAYLKNTQQALGREFSLVAEGRDMGTVIFPQATCKFFLDAAPEVRAKRRLRQLEAAGEKPDFQELLASIQARDEQDRNRAIAPLRPAEDAYIIDTGGLSVQDVFAAMLDRIPPGILS